MLVHLQVDAAQHRVLAVGLGHAAHLEHRGHRRCILSTSRASGIVTHRYSTAAATRGVYSKFEDASICATRNASSGPRIETRATSFCSEMKSLSSGGTTRRTACGSTTKRSAWRPVNPTASAAARWLGWMESMPARYTSAT